MSEVVAVVGGSRGTGAELSRQLLEAGHLVVVGYNSKPKRAEIVAGFRGPEKPNRPLDQPLYDDRAITAQIDVTDPLSRISFAKEVEQFARNHDTDVSTLALLGAGGLELGFGIRDAFSINADGQISTARVFWERIPEDVRAVPAMTLFAQSFQGHTVNHPNPNARAPFPDMYAPIAYSKQVGEIGLRVLAKEIWEKSDIEHYLAVEVGEELTDSDPIMILKRRAADSLARIEAGEATEEDHKNVEQMQAMESRYQEFLDAGLKLPKTKEYAAMMFERIQNPPDLDKGDDIVVTDYLPEVVFVNGVKTNLKETGNPIDWLQGIDLSLR